ncbi:hypothetical protein CYLTODRAFT_377450 [Cylindrobasidium torrendii FP15055 ss-10]|uniref:Uncharacterized protein n=1 Tax=Cylindrobasidium torrendii FP15055 ss-10 TaxID=1314674 RepID=A0A0D7B808_9AGAR|nr:hypothetical protein CYLTODRAFT_377450 [Cylindrobasidium torrendii FP15055 ss-10]
MAGTKRSAPDSSDRTTRSAKTAKTDNGSSPASKAKKPAAKKGPKANLTSKQFKEKALPLHLNVTHTPPTIAEDAVPASETDPGHLASVALAPSVFSAGSYGWKGSRRLTIEVDGEDGKKEKVQVQLTVNATVLGSKPPAGAKAKEDADEEEDGKEDGKEDGSADEGDE